MAPGTTARGPTAYPPHMPPTIAIAGATGAVGQEFLTLLEERNWARDHLRLLASPRSAGRTITFGGREIVIEALDEADPAGIDIALFSAGGSISRAHADRFLEAGATVIDNSSAFRMAPEVPLVVPEINPGDLGDGRLIANPNCSTIIALMAATPIHRAANVERMVVATYQAASGAGAAVMDELEQQARDVVEGSPLTTDVIGRQYIFNVYSHDSSIGEDGFNEEETKMRRETARIWNDDRPRVAATCVRVPVLRAHCAAIHLETTEPLSADEARELLRAAPGVQIVDDREANRFPEPIHAAGHDDVLVGRIRNDPSVPDGRGLAMFVAGDQLRKGAALNAVQIAELVCPAVRKTSEAANG